MFQIENVEVVSLLEHRLEIAHIWFPILVEIHFETEVYLRKEQRDSEEE